MRGFLRSAMFCVCFYGLLVLGASAETTKSLQIYFIDVEGGQATLLVSPSGQSMLVDTGWPDVNGRDADRIVAAAKDAGLKQIDYVVISHYHIDHVGGVTQLAERMKIGTFVDHGPNLEDSRMAREGYAAYQKVFANAKHLVVQPGDKIALEGVDVEVVTAAGKHIAAPLPGAGQQNPLCATETGSSPDASENAVSMGVLLTYGQFRFLDLVDLTKKKELELACPATLLPKVDLFLVSHHGLDQSNAKSLVWSLHPRVAVMNNGAHKGGSPAAWQIVHDSPGLEDLWQLHYAVEAGKEHNAPEQFVANGADGPDGKSIKATVLPDGTFTVRNSRNGFQKTYKK